MLTKQRQLYRRRPLLESLEDRRLLAATPTIRIDDVQQPEGDSGNSSFVFTVTRSGDTSGTSSVDFQTANDTATAGSDYMAIPSTTLNFDAGETARTITVNINGDTSPELDETFSINLSNPTDAIISDTTGRGTILDDDTTPTISFSDFSDPSGLTLVGSAVAPAGAGNVLRLTPAVGGQNGAAWYTAEKQFVSVDWETTFDFNLNENQDSPGGSDGFVFVVQNHDPTYLQGGGGTLGYNNLPNSLAVEFDTYQNTNVGDPSQSHISVHTNGIGPNSWDEALSLGSYSTPSIIDDAATHTARISYTPGTLSVFLDDLATPVLTVAVDLSETLDLDVGRAWVGFTAATGGGWQNHDILNWDYRVLADTSTTIGITNVSQLEGDAGTSDLVFTVTRSGDTSGTSLVDYQTANDTATAGSDYVAIPSTTLDFAADQTEQTITVTVNGDSLEEAHETLFVNLSGALGGNIVDGKGVGTILNDETTISISDGSAVEGADSLKDLGEFVADGSGGLSRPRNLVFGPDGNSDGIDDLYVASADTDEVLRYDGATGQFLDAFVTSASGGLENPAGLVFGANGLYVSSVGTNAVLRFDRITGAFVETVASGLVKPLGLTFDDAGNLYITDHGSNEVLRHDGTSLSVFVSAASNGLDNPRNAEFGPDGNGDGLADLYVASQGSKQVIRYDGVNGSFIDVFATVTPPLGPSVNGPNWLDFGTDGYLYVTSWTTSTCCDRSILRINELTGEVVDAFALERDGWSFTVGPDNVLYNSGNGFGNHVSRIGRASFAALTVNLSSPSGEVVTVDYSTSDGSATAGADYTGITSGTLSFAPGQTMAKIFVSTIDDAVEETTESFFVNLSNANGGTISDSQGQGKIIDDGPHSNPGDFNLDGMLDALDIDALSAAVLAGNHPLPFDLNGDQLVDQSDRRVWVEQIKRTSFGDSNLDGVINSRDLVQILQTGEYEDGIPGNSSWEEGDWNGDGDFTTADLVLALQSGQYVTTARPAASDWAAAIDTMMAGDDAKKAWAFVA